MRPSWCGYLILITACQSPASLPQAAPAIPGGHIQGRVLDGSGNGVPQAEVVLDGSPIRATSDPDGLFALHRLAVGTQSLIIRHHGFEPLRLPAAVESGQTLTVTAVLSPIVELLPIASPPPSEEAVD